MIMNGLAIPITKVLASKIFDDGPLTLAEARITTVKADHVAEKTGLHGIAIDNTATGGTLIAGTINTDHVSEKTVGHGVAITIPMAPVAGTNYVSIAFKQPQDFSPGEFFAQPVGLDGDRWKVPIAGTYRIRFRITTGNATNYNLAMRVYVNGSAVGTAYANPGNDNVYYTAAQDFTFAAGDAITFYGNSYAGGTSGTPTMHSAEIGVDSAIGSLIAVCMIRPYWG